MCSASAYASLPSSCQVIAITDEGGLVLDMTIFYAQGGGQPGDSGVVDWTDGRVPIATARRGQGAEIILLPAEPVSLPPVGVNVRQQIDLKRRFNHMRIHTALHLLGAIISAPVVDGAIGGPEGRLDFDDVKIPLDKKILTGQLNTLISRDLLVNAVQSGNRGVKEQGTDISQTASPDNTIRMVRIGDDKTTVDLQPCGGTHVSRTSEIGKVSITALDPLDDWSLRVILQLVT